MGLWQRETPRVRCEPAQREPRQAWVVNGWCTCLHGDRTECTMVETQKGDSGKVVLESKWKAGESCG